MPLPEWLNTKSNAARREEEWYRVNWDDVVSVQFTPDQLTLRRLSGSTVGDVKSAAANTPEGIAQSNQFQKALRQANWLELTSEKGAITFVDWNRIDGVSVKPEQVTPTNPAIARAVFRLYSAGAVVAQTSWEDDADKIYRKLKDTIED